MTLKRPTLKLIRTEPVFVSERKRMTTKKNMLAAIQIMVEGHNPTFDLLIDIFGTYGDVTMDKLLKALDDMNMRGEQIKLACDYIAERDSGGYDAFLDAVAKRDLAMIAHVNKTWPKAFIERAVRKGAAEFAHK